jgi:hypothetical protein
MRKLSLALVGILALPVALAAQAGLHPAFQPTRVAEREYNFALTDFDGGSALLFQWREGLGNSRSQFNVDLGLADGDGPADNSGAVIFGGSYHYQLTRASAELPFDMVFGAGLGLTAGDNYSIFRIPVGVAIGHRFPLEGNFAVSPYVHPRLSIDRLSVDGAGDDTDSNIDIDLGASFEISRQMQARLAVTFGDADAVGISFVWLPRGLR